MWLYSSIAATDRPQLQCVFTTFIHIQLILQIGDKKDFGHRNRPANNLPSRPL